MSFIFGIFLTLFVQLMANTFAFIVQTTLGPCFIKAFFQLRCKVIRMLITNLHQWILEAIANKGMEALPEHQIYINVFILNGKILQNLVIYLDVI